MRKRFTVGFMVLAWYVLPMYLCPLSLVIVNTQIGLLVCYEVFAIQKKAFEDTCSRRLFSYTIVICVFFMISPIFGPLDRKIVEASGWSA